MKTGVGFTYIFLKFHNITGYGLVIDTNYIVVKGVKSSMNSCSIISPFSTNYAPIFWILGTQQIMIETTKEVTHARTLQHSHLI